MVNQPTINAVNAGQTIPVKWALTDANNAAVGDQSAITSINSIAMSCTTGAPEDSVQASASTSGLRYQGGGSWIFNWATTKSWTGTCRELLVVLKDGTTQSATFRFR